MENLSRKHGTFDAIFLVQFQSEKDNGEIKSQMFIVMGCIWLLILLRCGLVGFGLQKIWHYLQSNLSTSSKSLDMSSGDGAIFHVLPKNPNEDSPISQLVERS